MVKISGQDLQKAVFTLSFDFKVKQLIKNLGLYRLISFADLHEDVEKEQVCLEHQFYVTVRVDKFEDLLKDF